MRGVNMSNKEWFEIYHSDTSDDEDVNVYIDKSQSKSFITDQDLVIIEEPSIHSN